MGQFNMSNMTEASDIYEYAWLSIYNSYRYGVNGTGRPGVDENGIPYTNFQKPNYTHEQAAEFASQHLFNYVNSETNFQRNSLNNALVYDVPGARYVFSGGTGNTRSSTMMDAYLVGTNGKLNPDAKYFLPKDSKYNSLFETAFRQEYNASLKAGTEKLNYLFIKI